MVGAAIAPVLERASSGVRVVTTAMEDRASVTLVLMFAVGSRYEPRHLNGASHFIEHMLFKGTTRLPDAKAISSAIETVGGVMNASTDKEVTAYWVKVPADKLELAMDVLSDIVLESKFEPTDVNRERQVIVEEIHMYQDLPQDQVHSLFDLLMWPEHPLGWDIAGTPESLAGQDSRQLRSYMRQHYRPDNLVVSLAGLVDSDRSLALIERYIADRLPGAAVVAPSASPPAPTAAAVSVQDKRTEQAHICLGYRALSYFDEDRHALDLISTALGEGMSSKLFVELREERGLAYDVHTYVVKHADTGMFGVYTGVEPSKALEAVAAIIEELGKVAGGQFSADDLRRAKEFSKGRLVIGLESTNAVANWFGHQELLQGEIVSAAQVIERIEAVSLEDINRVARRVFSGPLQLAAVGPFPDSSRFAELISAG